ncbi:MAG: hypothetical protein AABZ47_09865 [Planctomycetota bacterium]
MPESGPCSCAVIKKSGGWCPECKLGYLAGVRVTSRFFFEMLDAHGHDLDLTALQCPTCKKNATDGGYCDDCRIGFHKKKAYFTRLTYEFAQGVIVERETLPCDDCHKCPELIHWCERCGKGLLGNILISSKQDFEIARKEFERFLTALRMLPTCEGCAVAYFMRSLCPKCRKSWDGDEPAKKD